MFVEGTHLCTSIVNSGCGRGTTECVSPESRRDIRYSQGDGRDGHSGKKGGSGASHVSTLLTSCKPCYLRIGSKWLYPSHDDAGGVMRGGARYDRQWPVAGMRNYLL